MRRTRFPPSRRLLTGDLPNLPQGATLYRDDTIVQAQKPPGPLDRNSPLKRQSRFNPYNLWKTPSLEFTREKCRPRCSMANNWLKACKPKPLQLCSNSFRIMAFAPDWRRFWSATIQPANVI